MTLPAASAAAAKPLALALWLNGVMLVVSLAMLAVPILAPVLFTDLALPVASVSVYTGTLWAVPRRLVERGGAASAALVPGASHS